jgi:hypothetical protein
MARAVFWLTIVTGFTTSVLVMALPLHPAASSNLFKAAFGTDTFGALIAPVTFAHSTLSLCVQMMAGAFACFVAGEKQIPFAKLFGWILILGTIVFIGYSAFETFAAATPDPEDWALYRPLSTQQDTPFSLETMLQFTPYGACLLGAGFLLSTHQGYRWVWVPLAVTTALTTIATGTPSVDALPPGLIIGTVPTLLVLAIQMNDEDTNLAPYLTLLAIGCIVGYTEVQSTPYFLTNYWVMDSLLTRDTVLAGPAILLFFATLVRWRPTCAPSWALWAHACVLTASYAMMWGALYLIGETWSADPEKSTVDSYMPLQTAILIFCMVFLYGLWMIRKYRV